MTHNKTRLIALLLVVSFFNVYAQDTESHDVIVIGGGLTGLVSAYELANGGRDVLVLEAKDHVGGRVRTVRKGFADGQYAEMGATRIPDSHALVLNYVDKFHLPLVEFPLGDPLYKSNGVTYQSADAYMKQFSGSLTPEERELGMKGLQKKYIEPALKEFGKISDWRVDPQADKFDRITIGYYLKQRGASPAAIELLMRSQKVYLDSDTPASYWLAESQMMAKWDKTYAIKGGNDQLPKAFAGCLGNRVRLKSPVVEIRQKSDHVEVVYRDGNQTKVVSGKYVISAIPIGVLKWLKFDPPLSAEKRKAVDQLKSESTAKVNVQFSSRFWVGRVPRGLMVLSTDTPAERFWDMTVHQPGKSGILTSYSTGDNSEKLAHMTPEERKRMVVGVLAQTFPGADKQARIGYAKVWQNDPYERGGWLSTTPGQIAGALRALDSPEGRFFLASDDLSHFVGWMQGALESGLKAARQVNRVLPPLMAGAVRRAPLACAQAAAGAGNRVATVSAR